MGDYEGALEDFSFLIRFNPDETEAYSGRAIVRSAIGDKKGAVEDYSQAIRLNPLGTNAYLKRGQILSELRDKRGALKDLRNVERLYVIASSAKTDPPLRDFYQAMLKETRSLLRKLQR